jgi:hypothetical protein
MPEIKQSTDGSEPSPENKTIVSITADSEGPALTAEAVNRVKDVELVEPDAFDPFSPEALRIPQEYLDGIAATPLTVGIEVIKPHSQEYVRVHPDEGFRYCAPLIALKEEKDARYLIHPSFLKWVTASERIQFRFEMLYLYVTRAGKVAFWPVKVRTGRENSWLTSADAAAEHAKKKWVCIISNQKRGRYDVFEAKGDFPDPDWLEITQGKTLFQLLAIAFKEKLIMNENHPLIQKLLGLV